MTVLKAFLNRFLDKFERTWNYDAGYLRMVTRVEPKSAVKFVLGAGAADRSAAPAEAFAAVGVAGTLAEDCGPCTQIGVDMAAAAGVEPGVLRAILAGDEAAMGETAALAWRFAQASLARDLAEADPLREEVVRRWGEDGLVALSLALVAARMYPTLKYALGYGRTCSRVIVAGEPAAVAHPVLLAA
jgi:hypothetical protein